MQKIIDQILDENNDENVIITDHDGRPHIFEQIAVIPWEDEIYAILRPAESIPGVSEDEALVFQIDEEADQIYLATDDDVVDAVFDEYQKLLNDESAAHD